MATSFYSKSYLTARPLELSGYLLLGLFSLALAKDIIARRSLEERYPFCLMESKLELRFEVLSR